jgi:hypothetical protein
MHHETFTDFCIRIGATNKLPLARMYDSGTITPPEIHYQDDVPSPTMQKKYTLKESSLDHVTDDK